MSVSRDTCIEPKEQRLLIQSTAKRIVVLLPLQLAYTCRLHMAAYFRLEAQSKATRGVCPPKQAGQPSSQLTHICSLAPDQPGKGPGAFRPFRPLLRLPVKLQPVCC